VLSTTATGATCGGCCDGCSVCCSFGWSCIMCGGGRAWKGGIVKGGLNGGMVCGGGCNGLNIGGGAILKI